MIRITIERLSYPHPTSGIMVPAASVVKVFKDEAKARRWFIEDSFFTEPYVWQATWERVPNL